MDPNQHQQNPFPDTIPMQHQTQQPPQFQQQQQHQQFGQSPPHPQMPIGNNPSQQLHHQNMDFGSAPSQQQQQQTQQSQSQSQNQMDFGAPSAFSSGQAPPPQQPQFMPQQQHPQPPQQLNSEMQMAPATQQHPPQFGHSMQHQQPQPQPQYNNQQQPVAQMMQDQEQRQPQPEFGQHQYQQEQRAAPGPSPQQPVQQMQAAQSNQQPFQQQNNGQPPQPNIFDLHKKFENQANISSATPAGGAAGDASDWGDNEDGQQQNYHPVNQAGVSHMQHPQNSQFSFGQSQGGLQQQQHGQLPENTLPLTTNEELSMQSSHYVAELPVENPERKQPRRDKEKTLKVSTIYDWAANQAKNPHLARKESKQDSRQSMDVDSQEPTQYGAPGNGPLKPENVKALIYQEKNDVDEEINCDSCLDDYYDEEKRDDLVICEKCNVAVHQSCYGHGLLQQFPQGDWFCERCTVLIQQEQTQGFCDPRQLSCVLCHDLKGVIIKTNIGWVHLTCVNWMPEIWFEDENLKTVVAGEIPKERSTLNCSYCKGKNNRKIGCCIQCDFKDCHTSFHVRCAIDKELIKEWDEMDDHMVEDGWEAYLFCKKHLEQGKDALKNFGREGIKGIISDPKKQRDQRIRKQRAQRHVVDPTHQDVSSDEEDGDDFTDDVCQDLDVETENTIQEDIIRRPGGNKARRTSAHNQSFSSSKKKKQKTQGRQGSGGQAFQGVNNLDTLFPGMPQMPTGGNSKQKTNMSMDFLQQQMAHLTNQMMAQGSNPAQMAQMFSMGGNGMFPGMMPMPGMMPGMDTNPVNLGGGTKLINNIPKDESIGKPNNQGRRARRTGGNPGKPAARKSAQAESVKINFNSQSVGNTNNKQNQGHFSAPHGNQNNAFNMGQQQPQNAQQQTTYQGNPHQHQAPSTYMAPHSQQANQYNQHETHQHNQNARAPPQAPPKQQMQQHPVQQNTGFQSQAQAQAPYQQAPVQQQQQPQYPPPQFHPQQNTGMNQMYGQQSQYPAPQQQQTQPPQFTPQHQQQPPQFQQQQQQMYQQPHQSQFQQHQKQPAMQQQMPPQQMGGAPQQQANNNNTQQEDQFIIDPELKEFLGIGVSRGTRKEIQSAFIQAAIDKSFVNVSTHMYEIKKVPLLYGKIKQDSIPPKDIFKYLRQCFLQRIPRAF